MNEEQYKRYRKMDAENISVLIKKRDSSGNIHYLINGQSNVHYKVSVYTNGKITCSCPDFVNTCGVQECVCKHCLYVIYKVLKFTKRLDHAFFKRRFFTPDEMSLILKVK